jgi:hypothetical protein
VALAANHLDICRFGREEEAEYRKVIDNIKYLVEGAKRVLNVDILVEYAKFGKKQGFDLLRKELQ